MRYSTACSACRARRRKCEVPIGGGQCTYCATQNIACSRAGSIIQPKAVPVSPLSIATPTTPSVTEIIVASPTGITPVAAVSDKALCFELVELYFKYIHDCLHSLFHRPSFMLDLHEGTAPLALVYGMMALSARYVMIETVYPSESLPNYLRFSSNPIFNGIAPISRGELFANECNMLLNLRDVSLTSIQACVLLGAYSIVEGEAGAESVFYSAACRIANYLDLPSLPTPDPLQREIHIRVYWSLCMIDVWSSTGVNLPRLMERRMNVPLPMNESTFLNMTRANNNHFDFILSPNREDSLIAQMIKLNSILLKVNDAIKSLTSDSAVTNIDETVSTLAQELEAWELELPPNLRDTPSNLHSFAAQGLGRIFIAVHTGHYHYSQLLFYQYLDEVQRFPASPTAQIFARKCKENAVSMSRIIDLANTTPGCDAKFNMLGHIIVITSSIFIHTLLFETDEAEIANARATLERHFNTLVALRVYWPGLEVCFVRLKTFHELCRKSMNTSYRMDRWMLRFLTEFARPIDEKERDEDGNMDLDRWSVGNIGISPENWA
ncbi:putative transcriptional regulatory protein [Colletotrichum aenigma]|uniref:putative transcriptional regulatory protein n=1 Tax=Colletotrichum aenigma TaxID=1215731 RepID=UPI00187298BE|nr:putative transcriptional regulatory protein [Colletotrichum aenigma]KAF5507518.1 putative transcriptional regulatory protein [Colletotrichum aenigma]